MNLGRRVREAREKANLTQAELGSRLGVGAASVSKLQNERWGSRGPSLARLRRVARALRLPEGELLGASPREASARPRSTNNRNHGSTRRRAA